MVTYQHKDVKSCTHESRQSCLVLFTSPNGCSDKQLLLLIFGGERKASTLFEVCASNKCNQFVFLIDNRELA